MEQLTETIAFEFADFIMEHEGVPEHNCHLGDTIREYWLLMEFLKGVNNHHPNNEMPDVVFRFWTDGQTMSEVFTDTHEYFNDTCYSGMYVYDIDRSKLCFSFLYEGMIHRTYTVDFEQYLKDKSEVLKYIECQDFALPKLYHQEVEKYASIKNKNQTIILQQQLVPITR